ncbi:MAG: type II toxin-antitoxin system RelE/ParE family toxin [bacterium]
MIKYNLEFSKIFTKSFSKFDKNVKKLESEYGNCNIVKLTGLVNTYRLRSGDYRILFKKYDNRLLILLLDVKHRREVYKNL